jgi:hypothetical protein
VIELSAPRVALFRRFVGDLQATSPHPIPAPPDLSAFAPEDIEAARLAWASRIVDEYRSIAVFAELLHLLTDLEAPFAVLCTVHRLIGDELRHTQLTAMVVEWLGGTADLAIDLAEVSLPPPAADEPPLARAVQIVARELVGVEEESIFALAAYRNATTEPAIRAVLDLVLLDEVRHAASGRALLDELARGPLGPACAAELARLADQLVADREHLRSTYRASAIGGPGRALGGALEVADLEAMWLRVRTPGGTC